MKIKIITAAVLVLQLALIQCTDSSKNAPCQCKDGKRENKLISATRSSSICDIYGNTINISRVPRRAVSLVPAVTEIIEAVNGDYRLAGVVYQDAEKKTAEDAMVVGSFYSPAIAKVKSLKPELVFISSLHSNVVRALRKTDCRLVLLDAHTMDDIYKNITIIGRIFKNEKKARKKISSIKSQIDLIQKKLQFIPADKRLRVMRLMGTDPVMTPGDDSFQNEMIKLAGGIPIKTGRKGAVTNVSLGEWRSFNPQVVYGCGGSRALWKKFSGKLLWNGVEAAERNRYLDFPCDLTCRASVHAGDFITWLSASLYSSEFLSAPAVIKKSFIKKRKIDLDLPGIISANIVYGTIDDFPAKTFVINFNNTVKILSTLEGFREVKHAGNHYISPPRWLQIHGMSQADINRKICRSVDVKLEVSAFLQTGADMDNISISKKTFREHVVYAIVTAGVKSNAQRQSRDKGLYYPVGTINIIIITNRMLTPRAMTRAIVTATEAKTASLQDMDIRSSYTPAVNGATGTGSDNVLIVGGGGLKTDLSGGHTKLGELIASAVYEGVTAAVYKQNRIRKKRSIFTRLAERRISTYTLAREAHDSSDNSMETAKLVTAIDELLLENSIQGFIESSFTISDSYTPGLLSNYAFFKKEALLVASEICGKNIKELVKLDALSGYPEPLALALSAVVTGAINKIENIKKN